MTPIRRVLTVCAVAAAALTATAGTALANTHPCGDTYPTDGNWPTTAAPLDGTWPTAD
ncbi:hypothetical protein [Streptomyces sp. 6N223]|uniref:hypothetical protein n=1 Tax=Streptomyces sp. 6N223 TaxID=3457412 RepID=UPI003FD4A412